MDGKGRALDNVFIERLWWSVKYEHVYLHDHSTVRSLHQGLVTYLNYFNRERRHQSLACHTPWDVYRGAEVVAGSEGRARGGGRASGRAEAEGRAPSRRLA